MITLEQEIDRLEQRFIKKFRCDPDVNSCPYARNQVCFENGIMILRRFAATASNDIDCPSCRMNKGG